MGNKIDEKKIAEAKEKLACHILPPGEHPEGAAADSPWLKAMSDAASDSGSPESSAAASGAQTDFIDENGKVLLTRMTAAGG